MFANLPKMVDLVQLRENPTKHPGSKRQCVSLRKSNRREYKRRRKARQQNRGRY